MNAKRITEHELQRIMFTAYYLGRHDELNRKSEYEVTHEYVQQQTANTMAADLLHDNGTE